MGTNYYGWRRRQDGILAMFCFTRALAATVASNGTVDTAGAIATNTRGTKMEVSAFTLLHCLQKTKLKKKHGLK